MSEPSDKEEFKRRVLDWAEKLGVKVRSLAVRPMKSKWASCSTAGNLTFNAELLAFDWAVVDYVIVHELLHFFTPNHGKLWKSLMRTHLGDYEKAQVELEKVGTVPCLPSTMAEKCNGEGTVRERTKRT